MERKIIVIDAATSKRVILNTDAKTRGELSTLVKNAGVDVAGKDWLESLTKTTLTDDSSLLPTEAEYRGEKTNNLVFVLSNSNKKITLGVDRSELYDKVKKLNLQNTVKEITGRNFTQATNAALIDIIEDAELALENFNTSDNTETMSLQEKYNSLCFAVASLLVSLEDCITNDVNNAAARILSNKGGYELTDNDIDDILS